jgi:hypothetical protein
MVTAKRTADTMPNKAPSFAETGSVSMVRDIEGFFGDLVQNDKHAHIVEFHQPCRPQRAIDFIASLTSCNVLANHPCRPDDSRMEPTTKKRKQYQSPPDSPLNSVAGSKTPSPIVSPENSLKLLEESIAVSLSERFASANHDRLHSPQSIEDVPTAEFLTRAVLWD